MIYFIWQISKWWHLRQGKVSQACPSLLPRLPLVRRNWLQLQNIYEAWKFGRIGASKKAHESTIRLQNPSRGEKNCQQAWSLQCPTVPESRSQIRHWQLANTAVARPSHCLSRDKRWTCIHKIPRLQEILKMMRDWQILQLHDHSSVFQGTNSGQAFARFLAPSFLFMTFLSGLWWEWCSYNGFRWNSL